MPCPQPDGSVQGELEVEQEFSDLRAAGETLLASISVISRAHKEKLVNFVLEKLPVMDLEISAKKHKKELVDLICPFAFNRKRKIIQS